MDDVFLEIRFHRTGERNRQLYEDLTLKMRIRLHKKEGIKRIERFRLIFNNTVMAHIYIFF